MLGASKHLILSQALPVTADPEASGLLGQWKWDACQGQAESECTLGGEVWLSVRRTGLTSGEALKAEASFILANSFLRTVGGHSA